LQDWLNNNWLKQHATSRREIRDLLGVLDRNLTDCRVDVLSIDARFNFAYQAALQVGSIALRTCGFIPARGGYDHFRTIQSLALTMQVEADLVRVLDRFRSKRSTAMYDAAGTITETEMQEMIDLAVRLRGDLMEWLRNAHPTLLAEVKEEPR
jgi:hypothetical protein